MKGKLSSKGQVTVPKEVRDALGLKAGDSVSFMVMDGGQALLKPAKKWTIDDLAGFLEGYGKTPLPPKAVYRAEIAKKLAGLDDRTKSTKRR
jgi:antitoxin PrlF